MYPRQQKTGWFIVNSSLINSQILYSFMLNGQLVFLRIGGPLLLEQLQSESWGGLYTDHLNKKGRTTLSLKRHIKNNSIKDFTSDHFDRKRKSQKVVDNNVNHPDTQILNARGQIYKDILT